MNVSQVDFSAAKASEDFAHSLQHTGFAVLKNHPIDMQMVHDVYAEWKRFFNSEAKHNYTFKAETQAGYFPFKSENAKGEDLKDLKEFFHYYPWADHPKELSDKTKHLFSHLNNIATQLLTWLHEHTPKAISTKFSMPLDQMITNSTHTLLRIIHYPPLTGGEKPGEIRAAAHEDINLLTILPAATASGLQVRDKAGHWHEVSCSPEHLIINAGDMLQLCSEGFYQSTTHRVVNPEHSLSKEARMSMPLFLHAQNDVLLSPELTANQYRVQRLKEIGLL